MEEIVVKSQNDWDDVPKKFQGDVYIQSPSGSRLVIAERKGYTVVARGNSQVVARGNSQVVAWENSQVEAWENSQVEAWGNVQIAQYSEHAKLELRGNARIVKLPQTIQEYCDFNGITVKDGVAVLYKAVRPNGSSFNDSSFLYEVGKTVTNNCDPSVDNQCSYGLHVAHLHWAIDFGCQRGDFKIIECAVPIEKIIVPRNNDGKVRTSELMVLREVPMEEWGIYGKILVRKQNNKSKRR